uniref:Uncharacterized protein n=1 Tax=Timema bartmani TaxID=61472 RepID=A0A7R9ER25_9NEOP|nr:unnamed protein product [Timema bartmani]
MDQTRFPPLNYLFLRGTPARKLVRRDTEALSLGRINIPSYTDGQIFGTISTQKQAISKISTIVVFIDYFCLGCRESSLTPKNYYN